MLQAKNYENRPMFYGVIQQIKVAPFFETPGINTFATDCAFSIHYVLLIALSTLLRAIFFDKLLSRLFSSQMSLVLIILNIYQDILQKVIVATECNDIYVSMMIIVCKALITNEQVFSFIDTARYGNHNIKIQKSLIAYYSSQYDANKATAH